MQGRLHTNDVRAHKMRARVSLLVLLVAFSWIPLDDNSETLSIHCWLRPVQKISPGCHCPSLITLLAT